MSGNGKQRFVIALSLLIAASAGLYPPWRQRGGSVGYRFFFRPPDGATIDLSALAVE